MKQLLLCILTLTFFNLFGQDTPNTDPYWEFDKSNHFRPTLNREDFFQFTGFDFGWLVLEPMTRYIESREHELERSKGLSFGLKALYFWWYTIRHIPYTGFGYFYIDGYGIFVPTIIKSLEYIGDYKMASLIQKAENIYQNNKERLDQNDYSVLLDDDFNDAFGELVDLDKEYLSICKETMFNIENYFRKNPNEIFLDENGKEFDLNYSGQYVSNYSENKPKEIFTLINGIIDIEYKSFYENGNIKYHIKYDKGVQTGERVEWFENGYKKFSKTKVGDLFEYKWYYENGNHRLMEHKHKETEEIAGDYKEWYENGQLAISGTYKNFYQRQGPWLEFYKNGGKKVEASYSRYGELSIHNFWNERGEQTLKNGNGQYIKNELSTAEGNIEYTVEEYKGYKLHGEQKSYTNGLLSLSREMIDGELEGFTRSYYKNGKIKDEIIYKQSAEISRKLFPISENPKGIVSFQYKIMEEWLDSLGLPIADVYPVCLNENEILEIIKFPKKLLRIENHDSEGTIGIWFHIDESGNVAETELISASFSNGAEFIEVSDKMKFEPAKRDGKNVASYIYIVASFTVE